MKKESLIQKYFTNSLDNDEQAEFDNLIKNDDEFKALFNQYSNMKHVVSDHEKALLKEQLKTLERNHNFNRKGKDSLKKWMVAASVIILIVSGSAYVWYQMQYDSNTLFNTYFEPYPNALQPVVRSETDSNQISKAMSLYENKAYKESLELLDEALKMSEASDVRFYKAMCHINLNTLDTALRELDKLPKENFQFSHQVYWYKALIHLKLENKEQAIEILNKSISLSGFYKKAEAEELINKIK